MRCCSNQKVNKEENWKFLLFKKKKNQKVAEEPVLDQVLRVVVKKMLALYLFTLPCLGVRPDAL